MLLCPLHLGSLPAFSLGHSHQCFIFFFPVPSWLENCLVSTWLLSACPVSPSSDPWDRWFGLLFGPQDFLSASASPSPTTLPAFLLGSLSFVGRALLSRFDLLSLLCSGRMKGWLIVAGGQWRLVPGRPCVFSTRPKQEGK